MADEQDSQQKTEEPSARKLDEARKKGQLAVSREVTSWFTLAATGLVLTFIAPATSRALLPLLTRFVAAPDRLTIGNNLGPALWQMIEAIGAILLLPTAVLMLAAFAGPLLQNGFVIAFERLQPKLENLSPLSGLRRQFSLRSVVELAKSVAKLTVVGTVVWVLLRPELARLPLLPGMAAPAMMHEIAALITRMMAGVLGVMTLLALLDLGYQRFDFRKSMRMTKEEVKEEYRQVEGDPRVKGKLKQIRFERARRRMMAAVPGATVVVTNPTHYAIAFKYEMATMNAPVVVAKGVDSLALRIREIALANGVPLVENPPLARALYPAVEIDAEIPPEHYKAVAEIIGYVFRLQGKLRGGSAAAAAR